MLQTAQVKHAHTAIGTTADKYIHTSGAEPNIKYFFVVRNELRLGREGGYVPDGAGGVYAGCDDEFRRHGVPIEGRQRSRVLRRLGVGQESKGSELGKLWFSGIDRRRPRDRIAQCIAGSLGKRP